ncbi:MAG: hypothetical protein CMJ32_08295 [Phycisphaerae bacterium]|nr:hypothetical protein [Phycisphaerae bacterium]
MAGGAGWFIAALLGTIMMFTSGCSSFGSSKIVPDRSEYSEAIRTSSSQQLLMNIVRLRLGGTPELLDLTQIVSQYQIRTTGEAGGSITSGPNTYPFSIGAYIQETPTVTYSPVTGTEFATRMLAPIDDYQIFLLSRSGWDLQRLMSAVVQNINGLENLPTSVGLSAKSVPSTLEKFAEATWLMEMLETEGALEIYLQQAPPPPTPAAGGSKPSGPAANQKLHYVLAFTTQENNEELTGKISSLKTLLGLDPDVDVFPILMHPAKGLAGREIVIEMRSMLSIMLYLTGGIVLTEDLAEYYPEVFKQLKDRKEDGSWLHPVNFFRIHCSKTKPDSAYVKCRIEGSWYWIEKHDRTTKTTFTLIQYLSRLQEARTNSDNEGILLTIPTG